MEGIACDGHGEHGEAKGAFRSRTTRLSLLPLCQRGLSALLLIMLVRGFFGGFRGHKFFVVKGLGMYRLRTEFCEVL